MRQPFLVLGYGIPKDIFDDLNYTIYLRRVFNAVFDWCIKHDRWDPVLIFSGGKTDMLPPYRRTEAGEMIKSFRDLMKRASVKERTKKWALIPEARALSSLDNFLFTKEILKKKKLSPTALIVFGEQVRSRRLKSICKRVLGSTKIIVIDFDQSANRYLDPKFLQKKEREATKLDMWALKSLANLAKHRELFKRKMEYLREAGAENHIEAVRKWWEEELKNLK